jgi:hypothetical protein
VPAGIFPKLPEEGSPLLFRAEEGRGTHILNYLGKGKERLRIGGKESFQAQCMRDYWSPLLVVQVDPVRGQYQSTSTLRPWKPRRKHKRSDCLFARTWLEGSET